MLRGHFRPCSVDGNPVDLLAVLADQLYTRAEMLPSSYEIRFDRRSYIKPLVEYFYDDGVNPTDTKNCTSSIWGAFLLSFRTSALSLRAPP
jgi:hypothetical protein